MSDNLIEWLQPYRQDKGLVPPSGTGTKNIHPADTLYACQDVLNIDESIVTEKLLTKPSIL